MNDERARILKMLEDGKITAEEAARLLEAIRIQPWESGMFPFGRKIRKGLEQMPEIFSNVSKLIAEAVEAEFRGKGKITESSFGKKERVEIKTVSGDIEIEGWDKEEILLKLSGITQTNEHNNQLDLNVISGEVKVKLPKDTQLKLSSVSGDWEIEEVEGELEIRTISGDIELKEVKGVAVINTISGDIDGKELNGNFLVKSQSGDIDLAFKGVRQGELETKSGDITLALPKDANLVLELAAETGAIDLAIPEPFEKIETSKGYWKIGLGNKEGKLICRTESGDIEIKG
uniref:Uncharacterized protein n=1 Tax=candidate division WOR-3 bacterium TaxID=2052148 RepID=A0A7C6AAU4_UNCW3